MSAASRRYLVTAIIVDISLAASFVFVIYNPPEFYREFVLVWLPLAFAAVYWTLRAAGILRIRKDRPVGLLAALLIWLWVAASRGLVGPREVLSLLGIYAFLVIAYRYAFQPGVSEIKSKLKRLSRYVRRKQGHDN